MPKQLRYEFTSTGPPRGFVTGHGSGLLRVGLHIGGIEYFGCIYPHSSRFLRACRTRRLRSGSKVTESRPSISVINRHANTGMIHTPTCLPR